ncbi:purine nucleoside permease [Methylocapsa sp. S129]|uniref:purine-nucleoside phosphorylase n=1 Tax=Methylocapsa sp. S129 TaxID=1641869 RepID=UPI00131EC011|nr:purine nucleoside permease [Methylocapsa sp. S129]
MLREIGLSIAGLLWIAAPNQACAQASPFAPKVLVITMFGGEAKPWLEGEEFTRKIAIPGFPKAYPDVACTEGALCLMTTGMGYANAASSVSALVYSGRFDLSKTYFLIAGIAGVDPAQGTLGSAHWARYAIDGGLQNEIDAREMPSDWSTGYLTIGAGAPGRKADLRYGSEIYRLNEDLLQAAFKLTKDAGLSDGDAAKAYRARYESGPAASPPQVTICDTISSDTWWHGSKLDDAMQAWAKLITDGAANVCTTQQEDNATLTALKRGADAQLLDFNRIAVLRTASNFDREAPGQTAAESLAAKSGGYLPSVTNAYRVAGALAHAIVADWGTWSAGPSK